MEISDDTHAAVMAYLLDYGSVEKFVSARDGGQYYANAFDTALSREDRDALWAQGMANVSTGVTDVAGAVNYLRALRKLYS